MKRQNIFFEYFEALLVALVLAFFARTFVFQAFKIPSSSMEKTLLVGDHIFVNKFIYGNTFFDIERVLIPVRKVQRGDVIVFKFPGNPRIDYIKRVIGVGGDVVKGIEGVVYVNGSPLTEPYAVHQHDIYGYLAKDNFGPIQIPPGHFFVMGDNRDNSEDSRYWGTVPKSMIKGRAFLIYWSFDPPPHFYDNPSAGPRSIGDLFVVFNPFRIRWSRLFHVVR